MEYSPGLRGVIAGETSISTVGKEGTSLRYRGYDATELTKNNSYEEVASLIISDSLNGDQFKESFKKYYLESISDERLTYYLEDLKKNPIPNGMHPMDVLRTVVSASYQSEEVSNIEAVAKISAVVCYSIASSLQALLGAMAR